MSHRRVGILLVGSIVTIGVADRATAAGGFALHVDAASLKSPVSVQVDGVVFSTATRNVFGPGAEQTSCALRTTAQPIATFDVVAPNLPLHLSVVSKENNGFFVRRAGQYWSQCNGVTFSPREIQWEPGHYEIFPAARSTFSSQPVAVSYQIDLFDPASGAKLRGVSQLVLDSKLAAPRLVTIKTQPGRRKLRDEVSGRNCGQVALPDVPDLSLTIERPIPGLVIRPLPSVPSVWLRVASIGKDETLRSDCTGSFGNSDGTPRAPAGSPSYRTPSELRFANNDEGSFAISVGSAEADQPATVTLLLADAATKYDRLTVVPFGGASPTLTQRWIGFQLPMLDLHEIDAPGTFTYNSDALAAQVFAKLPKQALVYAKFAFDSATATGNSDEFPVKDEPLALLELSGERARVLAADGTRYTVKASHLLLAPSGSPVLLSRPRPLSPTMLEQVDTVLARLPPSADKLGVAYRARVDSWKACRAKAWAPFGAKLPQVMPGYEIASKSPGYVRIENAGHDAMDKKCGSTTAFAKETESTRVKLAAEIEKDRARLLAEAMVLFR